MAEETGGKLFTSKIKIGGSVYFLKDADARTLLTKLTGADTVDGSILNSIKLYGADASYGETTIAAALGKAEGNISTLNGTKTTEGSVKFQIYNDAKDAIFSVTDAVTRSATEEDVLAGTATEIGETIVVTPAKVTTIQEAIENAANSIGNLTINGLSPDENMAVVLDASNIKREGSDIDTIESTLSQAESDIDAVEGRLDTLENGKTVSGSVKNIVYTQTKDAIYTEATESTSEVTIAQAIKSNTDAIQAEVTRATEAEEALAADVTNLKADVNTKGSVKNIVFNESQYGTFRFTGADVSTTIAAAIQANADAIAANKKGSFRIVESVDDITLSEEGLGIIYLIRHNDTTENAAGNKVAAHYDEYIVISEDGSSYSFEFIGDTEITLDGYATQTWVTENAKDAIFIPAVAGSGVEGSDDYVAPKDAVTIGQAIEALQALVSEGTAAIRADLNAEISRATNAETTLQNNIDALAAETVMTMNNVDLDAGTNNITLKAKDINYKDATEAVGDPESEGYVPPKQAVTVKDAIDANAKAVADERTRATQAESNLQNEINGIDGRVENLEEKVSGQVVTSVNGVAANKTNNGAVVINSSIINQSEATETVYYTAEDAEVISGEKNIGDVKVAGKPAVTVKAAINNTEARLDKIESSTVTQTINGVASVVSGNFKDGVSITTELSAKDIKMDKEAEGSVSIFDKISGIINSNATAITSVSVKSGTGTWVVDPDDSEQLNWIDITLDTNNATFLVPSGE